MRQHALTQCPYSRLCYLHRHGQVVNDEHSVNLRSALILKLLLQHSAAGFEMSSSDQNIHTHCALQ